MHTGTSSFKGERAPGTVIRRVRCCCCVVRRRVNTHFSQNDSRFSRPPSALRLYGQAFLNKTICHVKLQCRTTPLPPSSPLLLLRLHLSFAVGAVPSPRGLHSRSTTSTIATSIAPHGGRTCSVNPTHAKWNHSTSQSSLSQPIMPPKATRWQVQ